MPFVVIADTSGKIISRHVGYNPGDEIALEKEIKELIVHNFPDTKFDVENTESK